MHGGVRVLWAIDSNLRNPMTQTEKKLLGTKMRLGDKCRLWDREIYLEDTRVGEFSEPTEITFADGTRSPCPWGETVASAVLRFLES
jgi:hypothetical protein